MNHKEILEKFANGSITPQEKQAFAEWLNNLPLDQYRQALMDHETIMSRSGVDGTPDLALLDSIHGLIEEKEKETAAPVILKIKWWRYAAAAIIIVLLGTGTYIKFAQPGKRELAQTNPVNTHDIQAPVENNAIITLSDGREISLNNVGKGRVAMQGNITIVKSDSGQIVYNGRSDEPKFNTLTNPAGSKMINLVLSDGTNVWLNSESTLRYPIAFQGAQRKVEVTGEAYFEVTHNASMPFVVRKGEAEITVLGTHFNVNGYDEQNTVDVTLLAGSVKVYQLSTRDSKLISPGQRASIAQQSGTGTPIQVKTAVDLDKVMAWRNGIFNFDQESITSIMLQLSRWYGASIFYQGDKPTDLFSGIINRNTNISQVLKLFERTGRVQFKIEGKKVTVMK